ncbi:MAG: dethiobiotin synthase [Actinomycetota bacterium]|nr:dethiobiotin synthase [Actinomycetota bacterium]
MPVSDATVVVSGTGTEVGKTWLAARLARMLRTEGISVAARKPVMSFDSSDATTDALVLASATGERDDTVCPPHRRYELAMAPPMAADALERPRIALDDLVDELELPSTGVSLIEGVGGLRSPLAHDGDTLSLVERVEPDYVVVVAPAGLGAINDVLTTRDALTDEWPLIVFLNRFDTSDDIHLRNLAWLRDRESIPLAITPRRIARCIAKLLPTTLDPDTRTMEVQ